MNSFLKFTMLSLFVIVLMSVKTGATTIIPFPNLGDMALAADAVVVAKATDNYEITDGETTFFRTKFTVLESIKGSMSISEEFDLQAWKQKHGDLQTVIWGDPEFREEGEYLLFLSQKSAAPFWNTMILSYGIFERENISGDIVFTPSKESLELEVMERPDGIEVEPLSVYRAKQLVNHLKDILAQNGTWDANEILASDEIIGSVLIDRVPPSHCTYLNIGGYDSRYTGFPGNDIVLYSEDDGDNTFTPASAVHTQVTSAVADMEASYGGIDWGYSGTFNFTPNCVDGSAVSFNGNFLDEIGPREAIVIYNDPCDQITDLSGCSGTLAIGGLYAGGTHTYDGLTWSTGYNSYVIMNNDIGPSSGCLTANEYKIVVTHELTHGLGIGHIPPASGSANMNPSCCNNILTLDEECLDYTYAPALPVELVRFSSEVKNDKTVFVNWETASELNTDYFEVQKSVNGASFKNFSTIKAAGTTYEKRKYQVFDEHPEIGLNYYRLRIVDLDGSESFSTIRSAEFKSDELSILDLFPNPAKEQIQVRFNLPDEQTVSIQVKDVSGKILETWEVESGKGVNRQWVDLSQFTSGVYLLTIEDERGRRKTERFIKD